MIEDLSDWIVVNLLLKYNLIKPSNYSEVEYWIRITIFTLLSTTPLLLLSWWFGTIQELITITIVFNTLRVYSGGFHASLENCIKITIPLITVLCLVSSYTSEYASIFLFISGFLGLYIMIKFVSIENRKLYLLYLIIFMISSLIFSIFGYDKIVNSVYMSIIIIYILLNKYTIKFFQWLDSKL